MNSTVEALNSFADRWAEALWRACWQGALFVAVVWLLCKLFPRLPLALRCWLWWLACVKLVITLVWPAGGVPVPVLRPASVKMPLVAAQSPSVSQPGSNAAIPSARVPGAASAPKSAAKPGPDVGARVDATNKSRRTYSAAMNSSEILPIRLPSAPTLIMLAWLAGLTGCVSAAGKQLLGLKSLMRQAVSLDETDLGAEVRRLGIFFGLTGPPRVLSSATATAPFVVGIAQPRVVLPASLLHSLTPEERRMLVAHELAHVRRRDLWLSAIPLLAQAIFFFFPPAWVASRSWQTAQEAACDAEAMVSTNSRPSEYAELLIQVASKDTKGRLIYALGATSAYYTLRDRLSILRNAGVVVGSVLRPISAFGGLVALAMVIPWNPTRRVEAARSAAITRAKPGIEYTFKELETLEGAQSASRSINSSAEIAGWTEDSTGKIQPVVWRNGKIVALPKPPRFDAGDALAINDVGIISMALAPNSDWDHRKAYLCTADGNPKHLFPLSNDPASSPNCLDNGGGTAGNAGNQARSARATLWRHGFQQDLPVPNCEQSGVNWINDIGNMVGFYHQSDRKDHAIAWIGGALQHLVGPGWTTSEATCINNLDQIVGCAAVDTGDLHGFVLENGALRDLGTLGGKQSIASRISMLGEVTGYSDTSTGDRHAFLWDKRRGMMDLNDMVRLPSGWVLVGAFTNQWGQIACDAMVSGKRRACFLERIASGPAIPRTHIFPIEQWFNPTKPFSLRVRQVQYKLVQSGKGQSIYLVIDGNRHRIPEWDEFHKAHFPLLHGGEKDAIIAPWSEQIPLGVPLTPNAHLAKTANSSKVYLVSNGQRRWVVNIEAFRRAGIRGDIREQSLDMMGPEGEPIR